MVYFNFLNKSKTALITSLVIVVLGIAGFSFKSSQIVGMDFKGGYAFDLKLKPNLNWERNIEMGNGGVWIKNLKIFACKNLESLIFIKKTLFTSLYNIYIYIYIKRRNLKFLWKKKISN